MSGIASSSSGSRGASLGTCALGGLVGGLVGGFFVVGVTLGLKAGVDFVASQDTWVLIVVPVLGLVLATMVLQGIGRSGVAEPRAGSRLDGWRTFPPGVVRADITGDVTDTAGEEERFPWRLAPIRALAVFATVGLGGPMGTEAPAAYLGEAAGSCLGGSRRWSPLLRPAALGGGAAGVAALMGIPLMGTAYLLELGWRHHAPLSAERVVAALIGGLVGWGIDVAFDLSLIRLIVPKDPPADLTEAAITALLIGVLSGTLTALAGSAIYRAKKWRASPGVRLALGGLATAITAMTLASIAEPTAAVGPGGGAIAWAEKDTAAPLTLLAVAVLRAVATTAAVAAGGCGGVFVPFLAIGDIGGRVFAPGLEIGHDLSGAAGAAAGIAGGYRLPFTALAMVLWLGGPRPAQLTCLATVLIAFLAGAGVGSALDRLKGLPRLRRPAAKSR